jgi:diketogulonate reductase-like aldo/keto reductase
MPVLGFGTHQIPKESVKQCVMIALKAGYRLIDSAPWYNNEGECGQAILEFCHETGVPRSDIFYTTKLGSNNGLTPSKEAIQISLDKCGLKYIDLYLIHTPEGGPEARRESWQAICAAQKEGKLKSIGISNFGIKHIEEFLNAGVPMPVVNQMDLHPFMTRTKIVALCDKHKISLEAWAPLVQGHRFEHPSISHLAVKYAKDPAQILIRYSLQKKYHPIPKSKSNDRIISNSDVFDFVITPEEMLHLDSLNEDLAVDWDPSRLP